MSSIKSIKWKRLDNAAKIFPATSGKNDSRVFRFSCELYEKVDSNILQDALNRTIEQFPFFSSVIRRGIFWYYLEHSDIKPVVKEEYRLPCSNLYYKDKRNLLFEVTYYNKRINLEVFHALTDGTGALEFLKQLTAYYICIKYEDTFKGKNILLNYNASLEEKESDSFQKYYTKNKNKNKSKNKNKFSRAYVIKGIKNDYEHIQIIEGVTSVKKMAELAKKYNTTITVLLTSIFLCSIHSDMTKRQEKKKVVLMIPINLRNYFKSNSARNFFSWFDVGYSFSKGEDFKDVLKSVKESFEKELNPEQISLSMNNLIELEQNLLLRIIPLNFKNIGMLIANKLSQYTETAIFSNIGKIELPEEFSPYIKLFDMFTSTPKIELCMCSYKDNLVLSFTSLFESSNIQRNFFRKLSNFGLDIEISAKQYN